MDTLVYNNACIERHSLYRRCPSTLKAISDRDYPHDKYCFDPKIKCFDADTYEHDCLHKKRLEKTVDAVIGVATLRNNVESQHRLMLVELRMGFSNTENLSVTKILEKVDHTRLLLGASIEIHTDSLFVFNDNFAQQAKSWFARKSRANAKLNACIPICVSEFDNTIMSPEQLPYIPIHSEQDIRKDIEPHLHKTDLKCFFKQICYWCKKAESYEFKNHAEFQSIKKVVACIWSTFKKQDFTFSEEDLLEKECMEENYTFLP